MEKPVNSNEGKVGVIIGRFQVPELHEGHKYLFKEVAKKCDTLIVLVGSTPAMNTIEDPMPYEVRHMMLSQYLAFNSDIVWAIAELPNTHSNETWSANVDDQLSGFDSEQITLYGSRDSFIPHYVGKHPTEVILSPFGQISATEARSSVEPICSPEFRKGMVHAANVRYPAVFPTVDVAIINKLQTKILLGRKPGEELWRLPGGFVDPTDESFEAAARREALEEANAELSGLTYLGSRKINDWRYKGRDKIMTTLFMGYCYNPTSIHPGDDLEEVKWFNIHEQNFLDNVMPAHRELLVDIKAHIS